MARLILGSSYYKCREIIFLEAAQRLLRGSLLYLTSPWQKKQEPPRKPGVTPVDNAR